MVLAIQRELGKKVVLKSFLNDPEMKGHLYNARVCLEVLGAFNV